MQMKCSNCQRPLYTEHPSAMAERLLSAACYCHVRIDVLEGLQAQSIDALNRSNIIRRRHMEREGIEERHIAPCVRWKEYPLPDNQMRQIGIAIAWHDRRNEAARKAKFEAEDDSEDEETEVVTPIKKVIAYPKPPQIADKDVVLLDNALNEIPMLSGGHRQLAHLIMASGGYQAAIKTLSAWKESVKS